MKRRDFLSGLLGASACAGLAKAEDFASSVIAQLRKQGFRSVVQERTLLGRVRITATREDGLREIILNPKTGEILRDLWTPAKGGLADIEIIGGKDGSSDQGGDDSPSSPRDDDDGDDDHGGNNDDDDDDDDDEDDDDEDNSGSGSGESGGGGSSGEGGGGDEDDDGDDGDDD